MLFVEQFIAATENQPTAVVLSAIIGALVSVHMLLRIFSTTKKPAYEFAKPASTLPFFDNTRDLMIFHHERLCDWFWDQCVT